MSFARRLERLRARSEALASLPETCPTCRSPVPCMPSSILLVPEGLYVETAPCRTCGGPGGGELALPYTTEVDIIGDRQPLVVVAGMSLAEWIERNGDCDFGSHLEPLFNWLRAGVHCS